MAKKAKVKTRRTKEQQKEIFDYLMAGNTQKKTAAKFGLSINGVQSLRRRFDSKALAPLKLAKAIKAKPALGGMSSKTKVEFNAGEVVFSWSFPRDMFMQMCLKGLFV